ncbi:MAG: hypothetical protein H6Q14_2540 [Bacteroidetes bacterium]|nr:hypothetical protein [Bacteroidota bacterium]
MAKTYILFLRGVMPTGKNRVPMSQLREILIWAGFENVQTWIQSGNVVLKTDLQPEVLAKTISKLIENKIGAQIPIVVKSREDLVQIIQQNPFQGEGYDISRVFFAMYNGELNEELKAKLLMEDFSPEYLSITQQVAYMYIPGTYGRGKLSNNFLEKKLKTVATSRNFNTISKMMELGVG